MRFRWRHGLCSRARGRHLPGHQVSLLSPAGLSQPLLSHPRSWHRGPSRAALPTGSHTCCPAGAIRGSVHLCRKPRVPLLAVLNAGSRECIIVPQSLQGMSFQEPCITGPLGSLTIGDGPVSPALTARDRGSGQYLAAMGKAATGLLSTVVQAAHCPRTPGRWEGRWG